MAVHVFPQRTALCRQGKVFEGISRTGPSFPYFIKPAQLTVQVSGTRIKTDSVFERSLSTLKVLETN